MRFSGFLIVVKDIQKAKKYYRDLFGLEMLADNDGNMILSGGLVLQEEKFWRGFLGKDVVPRNNACELYFEDENVDGFYERLKALYPKTEFVNPPKTHSWGQRAVRFYDPDGNLIEVGSPMAALKQNGADKNMTETNRLKLYAASEEQMEAFIAAQPEGSLKAAYTEMLDGCLSHPDRWEWYALWMIERKDGTHIGELCFKGIDGSGSTEIGYGIAENYRGCGYATEAVMAVIKWASAQKAVKRIEAETEDDNTASKRVLEKAGFVPTGKMGDEGPRYLWKAGQAGSEGGKTT